MGVMAEDSFMFKADQIEGREVTITNAPRPENRLGPGFRFLLRTVKVDRIPNVISWDELREVGARYGILIDPRDYRGHSWA